MTESLGRIKALPTTYKGIRMRSRLEAAWAQFFDEHETRWVYEGEGFDLDGVLYLPDFWLPDCRTFVEVKGLMDEASERKISALVAAAGLRGMGVVVAESPAGSRFHLRTGQDGRWALFGVCGSCLRGSFHALNGAWACGCCGSQNGDSGWTFRVNGDCN